MKGTIRKEKPNVSDVTARFKTHGLRFEILVNRDALKMLFIVIQPNKGLTQSLSEPETERGIPKRRVRAKEDQYFTGQTPGSLTEHQSVQHRSQA